MSHTIGTIDYDHCFISTQLVVLVLEGCYSCSCSCLTEGCRSSPRKWYTMIKKMMSNPIKVQYMYSSYSICLPRFFMCKLYIFIHLYCHKMYAICGILATQARSYKNIISYFLYWEVSAFRSIFSMIYLDFLSARRTGSGTRCIEHMITHLMAVYNVILVPIETNTGLVAFLPLRSPAPQILPLFPFRSA